MKQYRFKTNINCSGCIARITPHLDENKEIRNWVVDTVNPDKILTIATQNLDEEEVKKLIEKAGFTAKAL